MNTIEFFFDGKLTKIDFKNFPPTTTVLEFLRKYTNRTGTKEGCAEGDCGACTVVIAEPINGKLKYRAVNSCILFLPALHGKWLITIEDLGTPQKLHPIQIAFIQNYASQCGFCTPGFEMSIYALYKENPNPTDYQIIKAIEGNLCRCTGYRPIIDAAKSLRTLNNFKKNDPLTNLEPTVIDALKQVNLSKPIELTYNDQKYFIPFTLNQALEIIANQDQYTIINGSTDIALRKTKAKQKLKTIIDLEHIKELKFIDISENNVKIGAGTKIQDLLNSLNNEFQPLKKLLENFGATQIRNRATIAGNIATASPIGDIIPPLIALDAKITLKSLNSSRTIPLSDFIKGYRKTDLKKGEIITQIEFQIDPNKIYWFYKLSRRKALDISTVSLSVAIKTQNNIIQDIKLVYGGMAETVKRAYQTEKFLIGKTISEQTIEQAANIVYNEFNPISDARASQQARRILAQNLLKKFFFENLLIPVNI